MKKKILYVLLAIIFIVDIILTACLGLKVSLNYAEGVNLTFSVENTTIDMKKLDDIAKDVFGKNSYIIKNVEFFGDSALIKVKNVNDDQIISLCDKVSSELGTTLEFSDVKVSYVSNVKISSLIEPYILPIGLSLLLIVAYYAVRYRGSRQMVSLIKSLAIYFILYYSIYVIGRVPFTGLSMPLAMCLYLIVVILNTRKFEEEK